MSNQANRVANKLINEKSPYLLQHAYNPVDWYPWCEEAFAKAQSEDKPIFLSIGYSTCHWCHVMSRESFEDYEVAEMLNKDFISIKVDKEERPDIDSIYMNFCQAVSGSGGWPLTVFLNPKDKKPFFAGTYFPKESRYRYTGMMDLLPEIIYAWKNKKDEIEKTSAEIMDALNKDFTSNKSLSLDIITKAYTDLKNSFDKVHGGFGYYPKFPTPHNLRFLLKFYNLNKDEEALEMVTKTLDSMYKGGIFDHVGYGFSRYSTDNRWLVPHFEKMLYDNALLIITYLEAYQVTKNDRYRDISEKIIKYIIRDMTSEKGGFYSAEDADSEGEEGKFYLFTKGEIVDILSVDDGEMFCKYYDITDAGNFENRNILNLINTRLEDIENNVELKLKLDACIKKVFEYRKQRVYPFKDDKILVSWNGLMIAAMATAGRILENPEYTTIAEKAINFIMANMFDDRGRLLSRFRDNEAANKGYLDDYAFLVSGLIETYEATFKPYYLEKACNLTDDMIINFWDKEKGGFFLYGKDSEQLISRPKEIYDGAIPSGNSVATMNMLRLASMTGNTDFKEKAIKQFDTFGAVVSDNPSYYTHFMMAFLYANAKTKDIIITGTRDNEKTTQIINKINKRFLPNITVVLNDGDKDLYKLIPFIKDQEIDYTNPTIYVCEDGVCKQPIYDIDELIFN